MSNLNPSLLERLRQLNLSLRLQLDQAEARIPAINDLIEQLGAIDLLCEAALLGLVIYERHYDLSKGPRDSGQVLQSALMIPGGIGVLLWDTDEYLAFRSDPDPNEASLFLKFVPFDDCEGAVKALLLPQIEPLMELLMNRLGTIVRDQA